MHLITCPHCGPRDEIEFRYRGDATAKRPAPGAGEAAFYAYVYARENPKGWNTELWHHTYGCRRYVTLTRNTLTHEIKDAR